MTIHFNFISVGTVPLKSFDELCIEVRKHTGCSFGSNFDPYRENCIGWVIFNLLNENHLLERSWMKSQKEVMGSIFIT